MPLLQLGINSQLSHLRENSTEFLLISTVFYKVVEQYMKILENLEKLDGKTSFWKNLWV